jgi:hypothetical protein
VASYDETAGVYRQTVLSAFQDVEDNLAAEHSLPMKPTASKPPSPLRNAHSTSPSINIAPESSAISKSPRNRPRFSPVSAQPCH